MCTKNEKWKIMDHFTSHTNQRELQLGRGKNESCGHVCIVEEKVKIERVRKPKKMKEKQNRYEVCIIMVINTALMRQRKSGYP